MEPIQQLYSWQSQIDKANPNGAADMDVAKRLLKHSIECLEANAKLREQLAEMQADEDSLMADMQTLANDLMKAESKLKAASEQEPIGIVRMSSPPDGTPKPIPRWIMTADQSFLKDGDFIYAAPVPPVDMQELQRELENKKSSLHTIAEICTGAGCEDWVDLKRKLSEHAEFERKLAEQQAMIVEIRGCFEAAIIEGLFARLEELTNDTGSIRDLVERRLIPAATAAEKQNGKTFCHEELNTLLAQAREEGRKEAVPDADWLSNAIREADGQHNLGAGILAEMLVSKMLSA